MKIIAWRKKEKKLHNGVAAHERRWRGWDAWLLVEEIGVGEVVVAKAATEGEKSSNDKKKN
jgi:hypothetical protein